MRSAPARVEPRQMAARITSAVAVVGWQFAPGPGKWVGRSGNLAALATSSDWR